MLQKELVNIARGKKSHQSSTYASFKTDGPGRVSGVRTGTFSFHTEQDSYPFWCVDLERIYPIASIQIFNRDDGEQDRAKTVIVETSLDGHAWAIIHRGVVFFGGVVTGQPLKIPLMSKLAARFIKISLDEMEYLHLDQIEVYVGLNDVLFQHICDKYGLNHDRMVIANVNELRPAPYKLRFNRAEDIFGDVQAILISAEGRLGNYINQLIGATFTALHTGAKDIYIQNVGLIYLSGPVEIGDIRFLPAALYDSRAGMALSGYFFGLENFLLSQSAKSYAAQQTGIAEKYLRPLVLGAIGPNDNHNSVDTVVHFRSGDIFEGDGANAYYTQPPLSFYQLSVQYLRSLNRLGSVAVMYENKKNPAISKFIDYLEAEQIDFVEQSRPLADDVYTLINAKNIISSFGSFCAYIGMLSMTLKQFIFFRNSPMEHFDKNDLTLVKYVDYGDYISQNKWNNSDDQLNMMVKYSAAKINGPIIRSVSRTKR